MGNPIKSTSSVIPMIYAYTTPGVSYHEGWTKIGYTEHNVETRIKQQTHTANVKWHLEWKRKAIFIDDESSETFMDTDFHVFLKKNGIKREKNTEWFEITCPLSYQLFNKFRSHHGEYRSNDTVIPYNLREEQENAVKQTIAYWKDNDNGEFLWNAKPRFGKTLTSYEFCKRINAKNVLIVTNRPSIADSWYSDYVTYLGQPSGYCFVSEVGAIKDMPGVLTREQYLHHQKFDKNNKCIEFVSLQDLKGSIYFGGKYEKLEEIKNTKWDVLIIDEAHEGVDTYKTDVAFDQINRKFTLHLSGTPFKALANEKFKSDAIYNWTYADEQEKRCSWDDSKEDENPYDVLPKLNLYTYKMSDVVSGILERGIEIMGESEEYAFDLNEFFKTDNRGIFEHEESVDKFLDALTTQKKFPFSTEELRDELKHTLWLLNRVESARALAKKLKEHPIFKNYEIILAAGDGKIDDADETENSLVKVKDAIKNHNKKTITLSVGQLTTGVTVKEWTAVLMLSNVSSPALYMQAAFRAQNPCLFTNGTDYFERKMNAYVFDFDPARTLKIYDEFANNLSSGTAGGRGDSDFRKENISKLLNFFPVIGEDEDGEMIPLDAEKVLSIPRKIRSIEVVRRGFMSDFLFQNISHVFGAPQEVLNIIQKFDPIDEPDKTVRISGEEAEQLSLNEKGDVELPNDFVIGRSTEVFGEKIYAPDIEDIKDAFSKVENDTERNVAVEKLKEFMHNNVVKPVVNTAKIEYGGELRPRVKTQIEQKLKNSADILINRTVKDYEIKRNVLEKDRLESLMNRDISKESATSINKKFDKLQKEANASFQESLATVIHDFFTESCTTTVKTIETDKRETKKKEVEKDIRDHLRGFSRTIPAFLMAYGGNDVSLDNFEVNIPDDVFLEVTSITKKQFKRLRDGWDYPDPETGEQKHFEGGLFDQVVFDDAVKEFMELKRKLKDYFDENNKEDIFDYIPPQKTNQIFTPKLTVKKMVDMLEEENPGCFDDPNKTFIDLYMKSGLYITEIVKRLYRSDKMKKAFPNDKLRLKHIFEKQVYGLAPTEIIYRIANSYILGFDENMDLQHNHLILLDSLPLVKNGTLQEELDKRFKNN